MFELYKGQRRVWYTHFRAGVKHYEELLADDKDRQFFTDDFFKDLAKKKNETEKLQWKISILAMSFYAVLALNAFGSTADLSIFGLNLKGLGSIKEVCLLVIAGLNFANFTIYNSIVAMKALLQARLNAIMPTPFHGAFKLQSIDLTGDGHTASFLPPRHHYYTVLNKLRMSLLALSVIVSTALYLFILIAINAILIVDAWNFPTMELFWNRIICVFFVSVWLMWAIRWLPSLMVDGSD